MLLTCSAEPPSLCFRCSQSTSFLHSYPAGAEVNTLLADPASLQDLIKTAVMSAPLAVAQRAISNAQSPASLLDWRGAQLTLSCLSSTHMV